MPSPKREKITLNFGKGFTTVAYRQSIDFEKLNFEKASGKRKVLRRAGAIARGVMKRIFRFRKNSRIHSPPGTPPFAHAKHGRGLKQMVKFDLVKNDTAVIIGPEVRPEIKARTGKEVPATLNYGGMIRVTSRGLARSKQSRLYNLGHIVRIKRRNYTRPVYKVMKKVYTDLWFKGWLK